MKLTPAKVTTLMLVAVGGLIGIYVIRGLFAVEKKATPRPRVVTVPLAAAHLAPGTKITDTHVGNGPYPESELKEDHLRTTRMVVGRVVRKEIKPGNPIRGSDLYEPGENAPLQVAAGKQAVSVPIKESAEMVDGLIKPGDYVDVHFILDGTRSNGLDDRLARLGGVSMTLLKGVKVLALNKAFRQQAMLATGNSVTLELSPEQTNVLLVAQPRGAIAFSYNPDGEGDGLVALSHSDRATLWEVLGLKKRVKEPEEKPEDPFVTEAFRGAGNSALRWKKDGKKYDNSDSRNTNRNTDTSKDDVSPDDVFLNSGSRASGAPSRDDAADAPADPDIPQSQPGTARGGVRSRVGSMLRVRPSTVDSAGPTALRN